MAKGILQGDRKRARAQAGRVAAPKGPKPRSNQAKNGNTGPAARGGAAVKPRAGKMPARRTARPLAAGGERIDRAVAFVNARARVIGAEIIAIGKYLLRELFDGDPRAVTSKDPRKMRSFRDLAERPDCLLSYSTLWRAVNLAIQERKLGTVAALKQLTPSHKIELLSVDNPKIKRELAKEAAEEGWSTRELRTEVRRRAKVKGKKGPTRGGGEIALAEGSLKHVAKVARAGVLSPERVAALPVARLGRLVMLMEEVAAALTRSVAAARSALAGTAKAGPLPGGPVALSRID